MHQRGEHHQGRRNEWPERPHVVRSRKERMRGLGFFQHRGRWFKYRESIGCLSLRNDEADYFDTPGAVSFNSQTHESVMIRSWIMAWTSIVFAARFEPHVVPADDFQIVHVLAADFLTIDLKRHCRRVGVDLHRSDGILAFHMAARRDVKHGSSDQFAL